MCTLLTLRRAGGEWPLIVAANRDEMADRPTRPPARHWPDRDNVTAGLDLLAGGTWLGVNDDGLVAGVLNRRGSLGPDPAYRSRGELPLEALDHAEAEAAAEALSGLDPHAYRPFNMFVGDARKAFWLSSLDEAGEPGMRVAAIPQGVSMLTDCDLNDGASPRVGRYLPEFAAAPPPILGEDPAADDWTAWRALLSATEHDAGAGPNGAMNFMRDDGFGTVSASLIAVPRPLSAARAARWIYAAGRPHETPFEAVRL